MTDTNNFDQGYNSLYRRLLLEEVQKGFEFEYPEILSHAKRIAKFATEIAHAMRLSEECIEEIHFAAISHSIGNLHNSKAHLNPTYPILEKCPYVDEKPLKIISACQEHFDGTGPRGLRGEDIPIGARIIAVAHELDILLFEYHFREARKEIKRYSGTQFDPEVVEAFLRLPESLLRDKNKLQ